MKKNMFYNPRPDWSQKGRFGRVLIVAGSHRYTGSPIFNAVSALRAGADLVSIVAPKRAADMAAAWLPDLITEELDGELSREHLALIQARAKDCDSLIIGGGLKREEETYAAIREIIKSLDLPMVIDAEAIRALADEPEILAGQQAILTPHAGEFEALTGRPVELDEVKREEVVKTQARRLQTVILLKGHIDVISDGQAVWLNKTGSPYMTKGGFGDTLSGIAGALVARRSALPAAAQAAAYINGRAGELVAQKFGEGVLTSDIFDLIPRVIEEMVDSGGE